MDDSQESALEHLRERRSVLRREITAVAHWRRLLRAKIDLTVARGAGPAPLTTDDPVISGSVDVTGIAAQHLPTLCRVPNEGFAMTSLASLDAADHRLGGYEVELRRALMETTDDLVKHLSDSSSGSLPWSEAAVALARIAPGSAGPSAAVGVTGETDAAASAAAHP